MSGVGAPIAVGMVAPSFLLHGDVRRPLSSSEMRGRPWVLAFVRHWTPGGDAAAILAQLRGLGAILFIVSDAGVWSFRPDDEPVREGRRLLSVTRMGGQPEGRALSRCRATGELSTPEPEPPSRRRIV